MKIILFVFLCFFSLNSSFCIRVCSSWKDYLKLGRESSCRENLDAEDEFQSIVARWKKQVETYEIITNDGYILTIFRIVPMNNSSQPVLLVPSVYMNSISFVDREKKSLAHWFVEEGYDVWLLNIRGSKYGRRHIGLKDTDAVFWKFSFHEIGIYDIPKALSKIQMSNEQKVLLVGFDVGTSAAFVYASENSEEANKYLSGMISLSPIATANQAGFLTRLSYILGQYTLVPLVKIFNHGEITMSMKTIRGSVLCRRGVIWIQRLCDLSFQMGSGIDFRQQDPETLPIIINQNTGSEAAMNYQHLSQIISSKKFLKYNYGAQKNMIVYGRKSPPSYDLSKIRVPQVFIVGKNNKIDSVQDAEAAYEQISSKYRKGFILISYPAFGLMDFIQAKDVNELLHIPMIKQAKLLAA